MTFSVSKLETQLSLWFASVLRHVLVSCTTGLRTDSLYHDLIAKDPAGRALQGLSKAWTWQKIMEKGESGVQSCFLGWERVKARQTETHVCYNCKDVCYSKQMQR